MADGREAWTKDVWDRLQQSRRPAPARHVIERFAAVLFPDRVVHVDNRLADDDDGRAISGRICVYTERFLGLADLAGVASMTGIVSTPAQGTTVVSFVPRSALVRIDVVPGDGHVNSGAAWAADEARGGWPYAGEVSLVYDGLPGAIVLPSSDTDAFGRFVPSLVDDLSR